MADPVANRQTRKRFEGRRGRGVAIGMLQDGRLPMENIVTHPMPLADFQQGIDLVASGTTSVKVTLEP